MSNKCKVNNYTNFYAIDTHFSCLNNTPRKFVSIFLVKFYVVLIFISV